jgi:putative thioredoxin
MFFTIWKIPIFILENLVNKKNGKIILAKINVDENQGIAGQLEIQSIPTVYGFIDGKPVDAFHGAQPESIIEKMIDKLIEMAPGNETPRLLEEANSLFKDQKFMEAQQIYESLVGIDPGNPKIISGLLRCLIQLKKYDEAKEILGSLDDETLKNDEIEKINKLFSNLSDSNDSVVEELKSAVSNEPYDKEKRFELAEKYLSSNETELGFNELLTIYDQDPKWNNEAAKNKLLEYFDLLGFTDPKVITARKQLSTLMFK